MQTELLEYLTFRIMRLHIIDIQNVHKVGKYVRI